MRNAGMTITLGILLAAGTCGRCWGQVEAPNQPAPAATPEITFNSKLALLVWAAEGDGYKVVGRTPSDTPLRIPAGTDWCVTPLAGTTVAQAAAEVRSRSIPGLRLIGATDGDLVHLKELKSLRILILWNTQVTDSGLVQLKGLKELQKLVLADTRSPTRAW